MRALADALAAAVGNAVENLALFDRVGSTHEAALRLIEQVVEEELRPGPTLLVARRQSAGLGREGRSWRSPLGGLYMSLVSAGLGRDSVPLLPMLAAAGLQRAMTSLGVAEVGIKWPNDLLIGGRKVAGILSHARHATPLWVVVSAGVNLTAVPVVADSPPHPPTALSEHLPERPWQQWAPHLAAGFASAVTADARTTDDLLHTWRSNLAHRPGDELTVRLSSKKRYQGRYLGTTAEGHLRLECEGEERVVTSGDVFGER